MPIATINPATGETLKTFEQLSDREIDRKLQVAADAFQKYRKTSFAERAGLMQRAFFFQAEDGIRDHSR